MNVTHRGRSGLMAALACSSLFSMTIASAVSAAPVTAQATPAATVAAAAGSAPVFTPGKCQFTMSSSANQTEGKTYNCGTVAVPEDHSKPTGKLIQIAVAVFKSNATSPAPDPAIYLDGGPGGFTLVSASDNLSAFGAILDTRDLIFFDQRGTGYSTPSLYCSELTQLDHDLLAVELSPTEGAKRYTDASLACQKRLVGQGIDLSLYNTDQDAADVNAIRQALGYKTLNLYGISYGTLLGLAIMRDFPAGVRSAVLDSNVPPEQAMEVGQIAATNRVFNQLFNGCKADAGCNQAYPNLGKVFYATVDKLNKNPVVVSAPDPNDNKNYKVAIDGNAFQNIIFQIFYLTDQIPYLPAAIYGASRGNLTNLASINLFFVDEDKTFSVGMQYSVNCRERVAYETMDQVTKAATGLPQQLLDNQLPSLQGEFDVCAAWGAGKAPASDEQPIKSSIPALVMAGSYDPVTPPAYSKQVAQDLGNAQYVEIPNSGHGASIGSSDCNFSLVTSFFNAPTQKLDTSCVNSIGAPQWKTPSSQ